MTGLIFACPYCVLCMHALAHTKTTHTPQLKYEFSKQERLSAAHDGSIKSYLKYLNASNWSETWKSVEITEYLSTRSARFVRLLFSIENHLMNGSLWLDHSQNYWLFVLFYFFRYRISKSTFSTAKLIYQTVWWSTSWLLTSL